MAKLILLVVGAMVAGVLAEPPSSYLPPQARNSLSSVYGAPNGGFRSNGNGNGKASSFHSQRTGSKSFSYNSLHDNQFGGSPLKKSFGNGFGSAGSLSQQYGAPSQSFRGSSQNGFGAAGRSSNGFGVSQQYGAPSFGAAGNGFGVSQQYGAPSFGASSNGFGAASRSSNGFGGISQQYGAPSFGSSGNGFGSSNGFGVSQQYGAPSFGSSGNGFGSSGNGYASSGNGFGSSGNGFGASSRKLSSAAKFGGGSGFGAPAPVYGVPSSRYGAPSSRMDDDLAEPANYEYTYEVQAAEESGAEFGHQESREDESAKGVYHVLLPDGRTQIVEYEADEEGFRPNIRYEESNGYPAAGAPQGPY